MSARTRRRPRPAGSAWSWLLTTLPSAVAVVTLFALVMVGALLLQDMLDVGVWFLSAR